MSFGCCCRYSKATRITLYCAHQVREGMLTCVGPVCLAEPIGLLPRLIRFTFMFQSATTWYQSNKAKQVV